MTVWDIIFKLIFAYGISTVFFVLVFSIAYLFGPSFINHLFQRQLQIEKELSELRVNNKGGVFNRLHERKLDAYTDLYSKMVVTYQKFSAYSNIVQIVPKNMDNDTNKSKLEEEMNTAYTELKKAYFDSVILIPVEIENRISLLFEKIDLLTNMYKEFLIIKNLGITDKEILNPAFEKHMKASRDIKTELPKLLDDMRTVFRNDILKHD